MYVLCSLLRMMHYIEPPDVYIWLHYVPLAFINVAVFANVLVSSRLLWSTITDAATTTGFIHARPADHYSGLDTSRLLAFMMPLLRTPCIILHLFKHLASHDPGSPIHARKEAIIQNDWTIEAYKGSCANSCSGRVPSSEVACTASDGFIDVLKSRLLIKQKLMHILCISKK